MAIVAINRFGTEEKYLRIYCSEMFYSYGLIYFNF